MARRLTLSLSLVSASLTIFRLGIVSEGTAASNTLTLNYLEFMRLHESKPIKAVYHATSKTDFYSLLIQIFRRYVFAVNRNDFQNTICLLCHENENQTKLFYTCHTGYIQNQIPDKNKSTSLKLFLKD